MSSSANQRGRKRPRADHHDFFLDIMVICACNFFQTKRGAAGTRIFSAARRFLSPDRDATYTTPCGAVPPGRSQSLDPR